MNRARLGWLLAGWALLAAPASAEPSLSAAIDTYLQPETFSGAILVSQGGSIVFDKAYGAADTAHRYANKTTTSFPIGSLTRQYIATAVMMLIDKGRLSLGNTAGQFLHNLGPTEGATTIGDLLAVPPDAPGAARASLVLGGIVAANLAKPLTDILETDFFGPLFMSGSGLESGEIRGETRMARGYGADGVTASPPSPAGVAFTTTRDELRWIEAFFGDNLLSASSRATLLGAGQGWARADNLGEPAWSGAGTAPGFAAYVIHLPAQDTTVIVLANRDAAQAVQRIGLHLAQMAAAH
ncbi:MAG TPA: serine hydrolase domain-containing protein [Rhizomicrobium sp.]|jgi:CubicO group peptidase (beta-lactamase class C family)|nr:serine hydrolase domain-containing protein [Rhizomicrobium sp.]